MKTKYGENMLIELKKKRRFKYTINVYRNNSFVGNVTFNEIAKLAELEGGFE